MRQATLRKVCIVCGMTFSYERLTDLLDLDKSSIGLNLSESSIGLKELSPASSELLMAVSRTSHSHQLGHSEENDGIGTQTRQLLQPLERYESAWREQKLERIRKQAESLQERAMEQQKWPTQAKWSIIEKTAAIAVGSMVSELALGRRS